MLTDSRNRAWVCDLFSLDLNLAVGLGEIVARVLDVIDTYFFDLLDKKLPLLLDDIRDVLVVDVGVDVAFHESTSVIVFNVALPPLLRHAELLGESLLLEVVDCEVVCVGDEEFDPLALHVSLKLSHEPCSVALDLFGVGDREEGDLCEFLGGIVSEADSADDFFLIFHYDHCLVLFIEYEFNNIIFWHLGELPRKNILQVY